MIEYVEEAMRFVPCIIFIFIFFFDVREIQKKNKMDLIYNIGKQSNIVQPNKRINHFTSCNAETK